MGTFIWPKDSPNHLTFAVSEMSRTAALACARDFNTIIASRIFNDDAALLMELEILSVIYSPVKILTTWEPISLSSGTHSFVTDGELLTITLPMDANEFSKLPYSLTTEWIKAAIDANDWVLQDLKNAYRRIAQMTAVSPSGNGQSSEPIETLQTTKTIGIPDTPIGS